ncbi:hypothetical protein OsJ_35538 [Oryza sativa Japonica Group]|uniref:Uncharacterized protein n=1 Tax=Oryza sativa subsp. japonica TaxID=39947 RepID=A3CFT3_ORYSJ|nr:hypothetical protein OsJ_35538 [Oryza sativa Japonica Group]
MSNLGKVDFSNKVNKPRMSFSPLGLLPPPDPQQQKPLRQERQPEMAIGADKIVIPQQERLRPWGNADEQPEAWIGDPSVCWIVGLSTNNSHQSEKAPLVGQRMKHMYLILISTIKCSVRQIQ